MCVCLLGCDIITTAYIRKVFSFDSLLAVATAVAFKVTLCHRYVVVVVVCIIFFLLAANSCSVFVRGGMCDPRIQQLYMCNITI